MNQEKEALSASKEAIHPPLREVGHSRPFRVKCRALMAADRVQLYHG